jgi:uncharacterized protein (DUF2236 family)
VGLYPPDSVTWRVNRESAIVLAGGRALLLQLAHPAVAAGVFDHSDFRERPLRRLNRTLTLTLALTFGTREEALASARSINTTHRRIRGQGYQAGDPHLLLWVLATLVDTSLLAYQTFVGPLTTAEREAYYQEAKTIGGLLGIPTGYYPRGLEEFERYMAAMLDSDELAVDERARTLARSVLWPAIGPLPRATWHPVAALTAALLPERLRAAYGLPWGRLERGLAAMQRRSLQVLVPRLPRRLRYVPPARIAGTSNAA